MAWAEKLSNGTYRGLWRDETGRKRSKSGFTQPAQAKRFANDQELKNRRGDASYDGRGLTWGDWLPRWLELRRVEPATARSDQGRIDNYLLPKWGKVRMGQIRLDDVQAWVNDLDATPDLSPSTVRRIHYLMSASMKAAVRSGKITTNPCHLVQLPSPIPVKHRYLTRTEFDLTIHFMSNPYRAAAIILAGTGMRFGEMAGLHWDAVDLVNRRVTIRETWDYGARQIKPYPKSKKPRVVPLPQFVMDAIMALPVPDQRTCGFLHAKGAKCSGPLVLTSATGLPLTHSTMSHQHWQPALKLAGVEHARNHDLRHTYAAWLRLDGIDLEGVQKLLGHGSIITTQIYSDIGDAHHDRVLRALGDNAQVDSDTHG